MNEATLTVLPEDFSRRSLWEAMGYGSAEPDGQVRGMAENLISALLPASRLRYGYRIFEACRLSGNTIQIGGVQMHPGGVICSYLSGMERACVFVATAGEEFNIRLKEIALSGDIVSQFIADSIGSVLAEEAVSALEKDLGLKLGLSLPYSPGYCGWNVCEQSLLFSLLPERPCGVSLTSSSLMVPEKSVSGFYAMGDSLVRQPYHCEICNNSKCYKKRKK